MRVGDALRPLHIVGLLQPSDNVSARALDGLVITDISTAQETLGMLGRLSRIDLLVENQLLLELKSVEALNDLHLAQPLTYLRVGNYKLGLLINFNVLRLKDGIKRIINGY